MKPRAVLALLFWAFVLLWILQGDAVVQASGKPTAAPWPAEETGRHLDSQAKARDIALDNARKAIEDYLASQDPPLAHWKPTIAYIQKNLIAKEEAGTDIPEGAFTFKTWRVTLFPPDLDLLRRLDRQAFLEQDKQDRDTRIQLRLLTASKIFVGLLVLLTGVWGFTRLGDGTRGPWSRVLRLGMFSVAAVASAGLWLLP